MISVYKVNDFFVTYPHTYTHSLQYHYEKQFNGHNEWQRSVLIGTNLPDEMIYCDYLLTQRLTDFLCYVLMLVLTNFFPSYSSPIWYSSAFEMRTSREYDMYTQLLM